MSDIWVSWRSALVLVLVLPAGLRGAEPSHAQIEFFEKKIRPVFVKHCYKCHSAQAKKVKGGLLLDTRDGLRKGGASGPAIVPGDPAGSLLLKALRHEDLEMPPGVKLPDAVIADFQNWIKQGAVDPRTGKAVSQSTDIAAGKRFWSFQRPEAHAAPKVHDTTWPRTKIDAFILARLEQAGLSPSPPADRRTWMRRVS